MLADLVKEAEEKAEDLQHQCVDAERALADSEQLLEDVGRKYTENRIVKRKAPSKT